jgi:hypothetical protein
MISREIQRISATASGCHPFQTIFLSLSFSIKHSPPSAQKPRSFCVTPNILTTRTPYPFFTVHYTVGRTTPGLGGKKVAILVGSIVQSSIIEHEQVGEKKEEPSGLPYRARRKDPHNPHPRCSLFAHVCRDTRCPK